MDAEKSPPARLVMSQQGMQLRTEVVVVTQESEEYFLSEMFSTSPKKVVCKLLHRRLKSRST
eukprot:3011-Heterococcus_DN1.PRE.8